MDKKKFLVIAIVAFMVSMSIATLVLSNFPPQLHKSFMVELINVKFKK